MTVDLDRARRAAASVVDPELPMLTLEDLGVLQSVTADGDAVVVTITPTYSGCPALESMRADLARTLAGAGFEQVRVQVSLQPVWSSDRITERGRAALAGAGISAPARVGHREGPVPLQLTPTRRALRCPRCDSPDVELTAEFGATACRALYRCTACLEPFEHVKEI